MNTVDSLKDAQFAGRLLQAVRDAGTILMSEFGGSDLQAETKADGSPVLRADKRSSEFLERELPRIVDVPVLSEEGEWRGLQTESFFIVDPLDGTKEFMKGSTDFVINVALVEGGRLIFGSVYAPAKDAMYYAAAGQGAWKVTGQEAPARIRVSGRRSELVGIASLNHLSDTDLQALNRLGCATVTRMGSALKFCAVAEGTADVYVRHGRTMLWDTAAPHLVVTEAGGHMYYQTAAGLQAGFKLTLENKGFICSNLPLDSEFMRQYS